MANRYAVLVVVEAEDQKRAVEYVTRRFPDRLDRFLGNSAPPTWIGPTAYPVADADRYDFSREPSVSVSSGGSR